MYDQDSIYNPTSGLYKKVWGAPDQYLLKFSYISRPLQSTRQLAINSSL